MTGFCPEGIVLHVSLASEPTCEGLGDTSYIFAQTCRLHLGKFEMNLWPPASPLLQDSEHPGIWALPPGAKQVLPWAKQSFGGVCMCVHAVGGTYPWRRASFTKPLRLRRVTAFLPGIELRDSAAPPTTMMMAFPLPFFESK